MKVLIIAIGHPDNVFSLALHLAEKVDITVLYVVAGSRSQRGILDLDLRELKNGHYNSEESNAIFPEHITEMSKGKFNLELLKLPSYKITNYKNYELFLSLNRYINKNSFDIIHYNGATGFIYLLYILNKNKRKQFWTLHDYKSHSGEGNKKTDFITRFIARRKKLILVQHYQYLKDAVIKDFRIPESKVFLLYSGPLAVFSFFSTSYNLVPNEQYILFFGRISKYKGVDLLLKAYNKIDNPGYKLVVAGKGDIDETVNNNHIIIHNKYIPTEELIGLIKKAAFIVTPYRDATHSAVIATAYEFNKPVIASNVMGLNEVVANNKTGKLFRPNSIDDLKNKMETLMNDPGLIREYEKNIAFELKKGLLSWDNITDAYVKSYRQQA
ncbi:MAG: glycosyltransferase family 4 protein [bacterium]